MHVTESELIQQLIERAAQPTLLVALPAGLVLASNPAARQEFSAALTASGQPTLAELFALPQDSPLALLLAGSADAPARVVETLFREADEGRRIPVEVVVERVAHAGDDFALVTCQGMLSGQGRAGEADLLLALFDQNPLPLVLATPEGVHLRSNHAFAELSGFSPEELVGHSNLELKLWHDPADRARARKQLKDHGKIENLEAVLQKKDSSTMTCLLSSRVIEKDGQRRVINAIQDVTALKAAQRALQKSETLFRDFFRANPVATIITSPTGTVHLINPAFARDSGYTEQEVAGRTAQELGFWRDPEDRQRMVDAISERGFIDNLEAHFYAKNGKPMTCLVSSRAVDYAGETRILNIVHDVTEQRKAEEALRELEQAKSDFISIAAHELRTPLIAVIGYAELLQGGGCRSFDSALQDEYLSIIKSNAEVLNRLVDDLLDVGRIQIGRPLGVIPEETSMTELVEAAVGTVKLKSAQHRFAIIHKDPLPAIMWIDGGRITQVLNNLLINAVKYSPQGGTVTVRTGNDGERLSVTISDQGVGMSSEQVAQVFDRFYRANDERAPVYGLGLGMSIVKQIVDEHGGEISIASTPGEGTSVTFTLPIRTAGFW